MWMCAAFSGKDPHATFALCLHCPSPPDWLLDSNSLNSKASVCGHHPLLQYEWAPSTRAGMVSVSMDCPNCMSIKLGLTEKGSISECTDSHFSYPELSMSFKNKCFSDCHVVLVDFLSTWVVVYLFISLVTLWVDNLLIFLLEYDSTFRDFF